MQRSELLHCVDIDVSRFKVLKKREQIPVIAGSELAVDHMDSRGTSYSLDDAFRLRLMLDLIGHGDGAPSLPPSDAVNIPGRVVSEIIRVSGEHPLLQESGSDIWCGIVVFEEPQSDGTIGHFSQVFASTACRLQDFITYTKGCEAAEVTAVRVILVNASRAARFVRRRAQDLGISEGFEFPEFPAAR